jgi:MFS family permease
MSEQLPPSTSRRCQNLRLVWEAIRHWPTCLLRVSLATTDDRNAWNLCVEIFWASILGTAAAFNAAFAVRLGAENSHIGLLNSLPACVAILVSIPAGRFLEGCRRRQAWVLGSLFVHRLGYVLVALLPWFPLGDFNQGAALVVLLVAMSVSVNFFGVGFSSMLADVIPERRRAAVFAARNIINTGMLSAGMLLAGQWLNHIAFPLNYQAMYLIGFAASMISMVYLLKVQTPKTPVAAQRLHVARPLKVLWQTLRQAVHEQGDFVRIVTNTLLYGLGAWTAAPLYILYFVRQLDASDAWIGLHGTVANVSAIVGYAIWRRLVERWGESRTLKRTVMGAGLYPLLVGLSPALTPILFAAGLNGLIVPGVTLSHFNTLLKVCPQDRRPSFIGLYTTVMNAGAFVCPLIGVALANRFGLAPTLVGCGVFWLLGALSFRLWPIRVADTDVAR